MIRKKKNLASIIWWNVVAEAVRNALCLPSASALYIAIDPTAKQESDSL